MNKAVFSKCWHKWERKITNNGNPVYGAPYYHFEAGYKAGLRVRKRIPKIENCATCDAMKNCQTKCKLYQRSEAK